ncbi:IS3 family transposase [Thomasclavelia cocleata]|uniref:IS3 family transposase n=1 Tax=Thomasclavelia cocleata TaxID=69824 RepID=UPI003CD04405
MLILPFVWYSFYSSTRYKIWDYQQAKRLIFEYIETFYNTIRIHGHCDYLSPDEYEKKYYANQIKQLNLN